MALALEMNVSNDFSVLRLVTVPIFISVWPSLTLFWHHVIFLWIFNEDHINIKNECYKWIVRPNISQCTNFYLCLTMFDTTLTPCHLLWIFNEDGINIKNECHQWIVRPNISHHNCFFWKVQSIVNAGPLFTFTPPRQISIKLDMKKSIFSIFSDLEVNLVLPGPPEKAHIWWKWLFWYTPPKYAQHFFRHTRNLGHSYWENWEKVKFHPFFDDFFNFDTLYHVTTSFIGLQTSIFGSARKNTIKNMYVTIPLFPVISEIIGEMCQILTPYMAISTLTSKYEVKTWQ